MDNKKEAKPTSYLFGVSPLEFKDKTYEEVLKLKIDKGAELVRKLADESSEVFNNREVIPDAAEKYNEIVARLSDVVKALEFNEFLLNEFYVALKGKK